MLKKYFVLFIVNVFLKKFVRMERYQQGFIVSVDNNSLQLPLLTICFFAAATSLLTLRSVHAAWALNISFKLTYHTPSSTPLSHH